MPTDLLSYRGDAGLGLGSNPQIPVSTTKDLDVINQTADKIMSQNAAQNYEIFQAKIKDRDNLYKMLDEGQIKVGNILPQDKERIKKALDKQTEAFMNLRKTGFRDIDGVAAYKKATQDAQMDATQAQARYVYHTTENADLAKETLPDRQDARKKNMESSLSKFDNELKPYQHTLDFNFDVIKSYPKKVTVEKTDPKNPLMKIKETTTSILATLQEADKDFKEGGKEMYNQIELLKQYQSMPPDELGAWITASNNRLKPLGAEIKAHINKETGQIIIDESTPNFSAKWAMAADPQLSSSVSEVDKGALDIYKAQQDTRHDKVMEGAANTNAAANLMRARAYTALQNKKVAQLNDDEKRVKNFWDGVVGKVKEKDLKATEGGKLVTGDFVFTGDLPQGYQFIGGLNQKGEPIQLKPKKTPKGVEYYDTKFYDSNGGELDLRAQFNEYKKSGGKGSYSELRTNLLKSGKINMELVGQNGVGNFETAGQTSRAISNKGTSKGEQPIFSDENQDEE